MQLNQKAIKKLGITYFDAANYLKSDEDATLYFQICLDEWGNDPAFIVRCLGTIARARGMTQLAKDSGISREGLYKALSGNGNPEFGTVIKVINALGIKLHAIAKEK
jgi:probable addiction module antidote protein